MATKEAYKHLEGIMLDIGCGKNKEQNFVGMDKRPLEGVDIVHDLEVFPYPLKDESCLTIAAKHIIEHIKPWTMVDFMNELWRILKPGGRLAIVLPYGVNQFFIQDPTHCNPCNQATWQYYDPAYPLYQVYEPKPWKLVHNSFQVTGMMEVIMEKRGEEDEPERHYS